MVKISRPMKPTSIVNGTSAPPTSHSPIVTTAMPTQSQRRALRGKHDKRGRHRCCKLGQRAGVRGWNCFVDMYFVLQYANIVHRKKMKFQGRQPTLVVKRFVKRIEHNCIKNHLKSVFYKCCSLYIKRRR